MERIKASKNAMYKLVLDQADQLGIVLPLPASRKEIAFRGDETHVYHIGWQFGPSEFMFWLTHKKVLVAAIFTDGRCVRTETIVIPPDALRRKGISVESEA